MGTLLSINNYYYRRGGAEVVFLEHNRLLERYGWAVIPFAMSHNRNLTTEWNKYFINEIEFGEQYSFIEKLSRVPKVIYSLESRRNLARLLNDTQPDLCHIHNIYHHISPSILGLLKSRGIPIVMTLHDLKLSCPAYSMLTHDGVCERCRGGRLYNVFLHKCIKQSRMLSAIVMLESVLHSIIGSYRNNVDCFIVPSHFCIEKMVEWGWERARFKYVPNFVNTDDLQATDNVGEYFLYFGRLSPQKGLDTLIRASALAGVSVKIAGAGHEEQKLKRLADEIGANVTFLGYLRGEALHESIRLSRAVVLPSEGYENAPISLMESYALGKPVIGADIGGIPELIREGKTGVTFSSGSVDLLADRLRRFAEYPDSRLVDMGRQGRLWMEQNFTTNHYLNRVLELYRELGVAE